MLPQSINNQLNSKPKRIAFAIWTIFPISIISILFVILYNVYSIRSNWYHRNIVDSIVKCHAIEIANEFMIQVDLNPKTPFYLYPRFDEKNQKFEEAKGRLEKLAERSFYNILLTQINQPFALCVASRSGEKYHLNAILLLYEIIRLLLSGTIIFIFILYYDILWRKTFVRIKNWINQ
jgi:hypothetical protein